MSKVPTYTMHGSEGVPSRPWKCKVQPVLGVGWQATVIDREGEFVKMVPGKTAQESMERAQRILSPFTQRTWHFTEEEA